MTYAVAIDGYPSIGKPDALVTIVRAYEYACPYSEKSRTTMAALQTAYGDALRIVYRPFVVHPKLASASALAACAANLQGKFVEMDELLWTQGFGARTRSFDRSTKAPSVAGTGECWDQAGGCINVLRMASDAGLEVVQFEKDLGGQCVNNVWESMRDLHQLGVSATPGFFINGRFMSGALPLETFVTLVDEELALAKARTKKKGRKKASYYKTWVLDVGATEAPWEPVGVTP